MVVNHFGGLTNQAESATRSMENDDEAYRKYRPNWDQWKYWQPPQVSLNALERFLGGRRHKESIPNHKREANQGNATDDERHEGA